MKINRNLENLSSYQVEITEKSIKRFHTNESQILILPIEIWAKNILDNLNRYPEKSSQDLATQASKFHNTSFDFTIPVNGSDEGLD